MKIIVITRCYNEIKNIDRFVYGYSFADKIIVSDGGSKDGSIDKIKSYSNVELHHFDKFEVVNGEYWNPDNPHFNFIINTAKSYTPDWIILDDMDDVPNYLLRNNAREILWNCSHNQINAFRLYMWGEKQYFPFMNRDFDPDYKSLWAWKPNEINIVADESIRHGTLKGLSDKPFGLDIPNCLLHKSWLPETITEKVKRYNSLDLPTHHPLEFAGNPTDLPNWAKE